MNTYAVQILWEHTEPDRFCMPEGFFFFFEYLHNAVLQEALQLLGTGCSFGHSSVRYFNHDLQPSTKVNGCLCMVGGLLGRRWNEGTNLH